MWAVCPITKLWVKIVAEIVSKRAMNFLSLCTVGNDLFWALAKKTEVLLFLFK
jgi:hypothetical protein